MQTVNKVRKTKEVTFMSIPKHGQFDWSEGKSIKISDSHAMTLRGQMFSVNPHEIVTLQK